MISYLHIEHQKVAWNVKTMTAFFVARNEEKENEKHDNAEFEKVWNEYSVIFYNVDGEILSEQTITYGQSAIVPEAPQKEADAQYSYTFTGWSEDYTTVTSDLKIYPEYVSILRKYTVTFKDGELLLKGQEVKYGNDAELPTEPTRVEEEWGIWKFTGWLGNYLGITQNGVVQ